MSIENNKQMLMEGFLDGTLDGVQLAELKRLLETDPSLRETMTTEFRLRGLIGAARNPSKLDESVAAAIEDLSPKRQEEEIIRSIEEPRRHPFDWRHLLSWRMPLAVAAGLLVIASVTLYLNHRPNALVGVSKPSVKLADGWQVQPTGQAVYRVVQPDLIRLERGELFVQSTPVASRLPLKIETPNGLATAKGTQFYIGAHVDASNNPKGNPQMKNLTRVLVLTGVVTLANAYGEATGKADELLVAEAGKAPVNHAITANSSFALELYGQLAKENPGKNLFFSPYSMSSALAMAAEGARGETADQMGKVLGFPEAARHVGDDAQLLPWNTALIHTGMAALNERFQTKPVPQELRDRLAAARNELEESKAQEKKVYDAKPSENQLYQQWYQQWHQAWEQQNKSKAKLIALLSQVDQYEIRVANALYGEKSYPFQQAYLDTINKFYGTGAVVPADFRGNANSERVKINTWVEQQTHDRIKDLLAAGSLDKWTRLVLVNAIYFKGEWAVPFEQGETKQEDFLAGAERKVTVPMMRKDKMEGGRYGAFNADGSFFATPQRVSTSEKTDPKTLYPGPDGFLVAELPYKGKELSMVLLVPRDVDGLGALEKKMTSANLQTWLGKLQSRDMHVQMPKFKMETDYTMGESEDGKPKGMLPAMGMTRAFTDPRKPLIGAQFDGMCASSDPKLKLYISKVVHKAFVEVTEKGTEAAAATGVAMEVACSMPVDVPFTPTFRADKPFLFAIRDVKTGTILFLGRMVDPSGTAGSN